VGMAVAADHDGGTLGQPQITLPQDQCLPAQRRRPSWGCRAFNCGFI
jgi:hypothetical protein